MKTCDLLIVGGGPAGLSAAISAASEGLTTVLCESRILGGQAQMSTMIRNYPGFPEGVTGRDLMHKLVSQATYFRTDILCPVKVVGLTPTDSGYIATTDEEKEDILCKVVVLASGLSYTRLKARNVDAFLGRGVNYGMPAMPIDPAKKNIYIVGGANSAGQAAWNFSKNQDRRIIMLIRGESLESSMSAYLIDELRACGNVAVWTHTEVKEVLGGETMTQLLLSTPDGEKTVPADEMCIFIGAQPKTYWIKSIVATDERGYIRTNGEAGHGFNYQTNLPGVFCVGDVRANSIKRIANAVGEGSSVVAHIHRYLKDKKERK